MAAGFAASALIIIIAIKLVPVIAIWEVAEHYEEEKVIARKDASGPAYGQERLGHTPPSPGLAESGGGRLAMTQRNIGRAVISSTVVVAAWLLVTGIALAQARGVATIELTAPANGAVGSEMTITARLTDQTAGPIADTEIIFQSSLVFLNALGDVEVGRGTTDQLGVATLTFVPRSEGETEIIAIFEGTAQYTDAFEITPVVVAAGPAQYTQEAGINVPGINVSLLVMILSAVWGTYIAVMYRVIPRLREGSKYSSYSDVSSRRPFILPRKDSSKTPRNDNASQRTKQQPKKDPGNETRALVSNWPTV